MYGDENGTSRIDERPIRPVASSGPQEWQREQPGGGNYPTQGNYAGNIPSRGRGGIDPRTVMTILGIFASVCAVMVFISTFLPWFSVNGVSHTGMELMTMDAQGFFMIRWGGGGIIFTGFFSLLFGALMLIAAILLFVDNRGGAIWSITIGVFGFFLALVNIIMVYTTYDAPSAAPGIGQWLMLGFSIIILVCGAVGLRYSQ